jgi:two-component system NarL family sensor kinase
MNDIFALVLVITIVFLLLSVFIVVFFLVFQRRKLEYLQEKTILRGQHAQELLQTQIEIQNATLQQIGQELHDNIGQLLSVARINLNILEDMIHPPETFIYIHETNEIIDKSIHDLRGLTKSLDGDFVKDFGLKESLAQELLRIKRTKRFQTELHVSDDYLRIGFEKEIVLFRIAQEILNNTIKHSHATHIAATLKSENEEFIMSIEDNGKGFELHQQSDLGNSGAGLRNMTRRAVLIGATLNVKTQPDLGTRISVSLRVMNNHED